MVLDHLATVHLLRPASLICATKWSVSQPYLWPRNLAQQTNIYFWHYSCVSPRDINSLPSTWDMWPLATRILNFNYYQLALQILKIRDRPCTPTSMQSSRLPLPSSAWALVWNGDFLQLLLCDHPIPSFSWNGPFLRRPLFFLDVDLSNLAMHPSLLLIVAESLPLLWRLTLCLGTLPLSLERISTWLWSVLAWVWPSIFCCSPLIAIFSSRISCLALMRVLGSELYFSTCWYMLRLLANAPLAILSVLSINSVPVWRSPLLLTPQLHVPKRSLRANDNLSSNLLTKTRKFIKLLRTTTQIWENKAKKIQSKYYRFLVQTKCWFFWQAPSL